MKKLFENFEIGFGIESGISLGIGIVHQEDNSTVFYIDILMFSFDISYIPEGVK